MDTLNTLNKYPATITVQQFMDDYTNLIGNLRANRCSMRVDGLIVTGVTHPTIDQYYVFCRTRFDSLETFWHPVTVNTEISVTWFPVGNMRELMTRLFPTNHYPVEVKEWESVLPDKGDTSIIEGLKRLPFQMLFVIALQVKDEPMRSMLIQFAFEEASVSGPFEKMSFELIKQAGADFDSTERKLKAEQSLVLQNYHMGDISENQFHAAYKSLEAQIMAAKTERDAEIEKIEGQCDDDREALVGLLRDEYRARIANQLMHLSVA